MSDDDAVTGAATPVDPNALWRAALSRGLLGAGAALLAREPSRQPQTIGPAIARGLLGVQDGLGQARRGLLGEPRPGEAAYWRELARQLMRVLEGRVGPATSRPDPSAR